MKKVNITFLLIVLLSMIGLNASAHSIEVKNADGVTIYYSFINNNNNTELAVTYRGSSISDYSDEYTGSVVIPESVTYNEKTYCVTSIGDWAFLYCSDLTSVTIPNNVTSIGNSAFYGCSGLTSVTIPNSVTSIGSSAFSGCSGIASIEIPNSVTSIGSSAFDGTTWYKNKPNGLVYAGKFAYKYKGTMQANTSITIKDGTLGIAVAAFENCSELISIIIPNSVTIIGSSAFKGCSGLTSITIPKSVSVVENSAFSGCFGLTSVNIPNSVSNIEFSAFSGCSSLTSITIPNSVTTIGGNAFDGCSGLTSIKIPNSVTSIGGGAFQGCSGLKSVTIPNSVTSIGGSAFYGCLGLTSVTIPNSVTSIGGGAFDKCSGLTSVTIPSSVTSIKSSAFSGCNNLKFVYALSEFPSFVKMSNNSFPVSQSSFRSTLYVKKGLKDLYSKSDGWKNFVDIREMTDEQYEELVKETNGEHETSVKSIDTSNTSASKYFSIDGKQFSQPQKGLNILKMSDGTTRKVVK